jgi:hypothetical protein
MTWLFARGTKFCFPERIFEELEPRIVLDASVDSLACDDLPDHLDVHAAWSQALVEEGPADRVAAVADDRADPDFNVVLISSALPEQGMLIDAASRHAEVLVFDAAQDNLDTITVRLHDMVESSGRKIDHLAVLDHAKAGEWRIGSDRFSLFSLPQRRASFETLGSLLTDDGQIQLYGCELAGNPMGQALVDRIALYTHADVFASFDKVGGGSRHQVPETSPQPAAEASPPLAALASPSITLESAVWTVHGDHAQAIPEITVSDPGSPYVDVVLSANHGRLSAPNPLPHPGVEVRGNNGALEPVLRLSGFLNELNDTLKQVTYTPAQNTTGNDMLTVQMQSRGGYSNNLAPMPVIEKELAVEVIVP